MNPHSRNAYREAAKNDHPAGRIDTTLTRTVTGHPFRNCRLQAMLSKTEKKRREEWQHRREEILCAAIELVAEHGYSGTTMQGIADRVDCSVGYIYRHFKSKLMLARVLVDREIGFFEKLGDRAQERGLPPLATYRSLLEETSRYLAARRPLVRVFTRETVLRHLPETQQRYRKARERDCALMRQACSEGELPDIDCELFGTVLHGVVDSLMAHLAQQKDPEALLRLPDLVFELIIDPLRQRPRTPRPQKKKSK